MKHFKDIQIPFFRTAYNYDTDEASNASAIHFPEPTLCVQSQAEDTDINTIVRRFGLTGELPQGVRSPTYGDFVGTTDYTTALALIQEADEAFYSMPADVRSRFNNQPAAFLDFIDNPLNHDEAISLGLVFKPQEPLAKVDETS